MRNIGFTIGENIAIGAMALVSSAMTHMGLVPLFPASGPNVFLPDILAVAIFFTLIAYWKRLRSSMQFVHAQAPISKLYAYAGMVCMTAIILGLSTLTSFVGVISQDVLEIETNSQITKAKHELSRVERYLQNYKNLLKSLENEGKHLENIATEDIEKGTHTGTSGRGGFSSSLKLNGEAMSLFATERLKDLNEIEPLKKKAISSLNSISELAKNGEIRSDRKRLTQLRGEFELSLSKMSAIPARKLLKNFAQQIIGSIKLNRTSDKINIKRKQIALAKSLGERLDKYAKSLIKTLQNLTIPYADTSFKIVTVYQAAWKQFRGFLIPLTFSIMVDFMPLGLSFFDQSSRIQGAEEYKQNELMENTTLADMARLKQAKALYDGTINQQPETEKPNIKPENKSKSKSNSISYNQVNGNATKHKEN